MRKGKNNKTVSIMICAAMAMSAASVPAYADDGEKTTISILTDVSKDSVGSSGYATGFYTALEDWEKEHPEVEVSIEEMDQTSYQTKISALGSAEDMPDIFMLKGSWTKNFVDNGWVADITDDLDADPDWKNGYLDGAFQWATYDDRIYGVPREWVTTGIVFYNSDMWKEIGYDEFPTTWDDLLDAVDKFNEKGIDTFVMGNKPNWPAESCWLSTLGDRYTGSDWTISIVNGDGEAKFTDESFVNALTTFQGLADKGAFNEDINSIDDQEQMTVYYNKKAAAIVNGSWFIPSVDTSAPDDVKNATKLALLPAVSDGTDQQNTISGGCVWFTSLSSNEMNDDKHALCIDLIKALTSQKVADITASYGGVTPWASPEYDKSAVPALYTEYLELMTSAVTVPVYDACMDSSVIETMNSGLQSLLIDEITPEDLANDIQLSQEQVLF